MGELGLREGAAEQARPTVAGSARKCGSAGVKRWQWQCCKLMVALRHQMDKQAGALRKLLLAAAARRLPKHQLDERTDKFKAVAGCTAAKRKGNRAGNGRHLGRWYW